MVKEVFTDYFTTMRIPVSTLTKLRRRGKAGMADYEIIEKILKKVK